MTNEAETTPRVDVLVHQAINGKYQEADTRHLDPDTRALIRAIHNRYRKRAKAEAELQKFRRNGEMGTYRPDNFIFTLLADYVIDMAVQREETQPASLEQHRQRVKRIWGEYRNRVLRYSY